MIAYINASSAVYFKLTLYNRMSEVSANMSSSILTGHLFSLLFTKIRPAECIGKKSVKRVLYNTKKN